MRKLEIGSGNRPLDDYEHLDINPACPHLEYIAPMDQIPVDDEIFDEIQAIHVLEHTQWRNVLPTLKEWFRILKPGGFVRIAVPNFRWIAECYLKSRTEEDSAWKNDVSVMHPEEIAHLKVQDDLEVALWVNFKVMSSGDSWDQHYTCFDATLLRKLLITAGASTVDIEHDSSSLVVKACKS